MPKRTNTIIIYAAKCNIDGVKKEHLTRSLEDAKSYLDKWNIEDSIVEMKKSHDVIEYGTINQIKEYDGSDTHVRYDCLSDNDEFSYIRFKIQRYKVK